MLNITISNSNVNVQLFLMPVSSQKISLLLSPVEMYIFLVLVLQFSYRQRLLVSNLTGVPL